MSNNNEKNQNQKTQAHKIQNYLKTTSESQPQEEQSFLFSQSIGFNSLNKPSRDLECASNKNKNSIIQKQTSKSLGELQIIFKLQADNQASYKTIKRQAILLSPLLLVTATDNLYCNFLVKNNESFDSIQTFQLNPAIRSSSKSQVTTQFVAKAKFADQIYFIPENNLKLKVQKIPFSSYLFKSISPEQKYQQFGVTFLILKDKQLEQNYTSNILKMNFHYNFDSYSHKEVFIFNAQKKEFTKRLNIQNQQNHLIFFQQQITKQDLGGPILFQSSDKCVQIIGILLGKKNNLSYGLLFSSLLQDKFFLDEIISENNLHQHYPQLERSQHFIEYKQSERKRKQSSKAKQIFLQKIFGSQKEVNKNYRLLIEEDLQFYQDKEYIEQQYQINLSTRKYYLNLSNKSKVVTLYLKEFLSFDWDQVEWLEMSFCQISNQVWNILTQNSNRFKCLMIFSVCKSIYKISVSNYITNVKEGSVDNFTNLKCISFGQTVGNQYYDSQTLRYFQNLKLRMRVVYLKAIKLNFK